ncbi:MAG: hypothetical protein K9W42_00170 [Candidatus Heimdallarchaeota archaeon]|nr:hypothetical protein [Candidatus Heimdallarchaeota archaeon]
MHKAPEGYIASYFIKSIFAKRKTTKKADLMIVVNDYWKDYYAQKGVNKDKIITIENFPSLKLMRALKRTDCIDPFIATEKRRKAVFSSANLKASEDFKRKIDSNIKAVSELKDWVLVIFGEKSKRYLKQGVKFLDVRPVEGYLANCAKCDLLINPLELNTRNHHSSPDRIFEGALLGLRIISTKAASLFEKFGDTIIWVSNEHTKDEIKQILTNLETFPNGKNTQEKAKNYTWEKQEEILISRYNNLIKTS